MWGGLLPSLHQRGAYRMSTYTERQTAKADEAIGAASYHIDRLTEHGAATRAERAQVATAYAVARTLRAILAELHELRTRRHDA